MISASSAGSLLSHKSAICLIPHRSVWPSIQAVRCIHDKSFTRWPPHINLLYPFLPDSVSGAEFAKAAQLATQRLSAVNTFKVTLTSFGMFTHSKSCTIWLDPCSEELLELQATLQSAFQQCSDLSDDPQRGITAFRPHLSLGQWRTPAAARAAKQEMEEIWAPISFTVEAVALISRRNFKDPFCERWQIPLGGVNGSDSSEFAEIGSGNGGQCRNRDDGKGVDSVMEAREVNMRYVAMAESAE